MKTEPRRNAAAIPSRRLDLRDIEQAALLGEVYAKERETTAMALAELAGLGFDGRTGREATALATMEPLPGHEVMEQVERRLLRARRTLFLAACHAHRRN